MKQSLLDKFMSKKGLYTSFWIIAIFMVTILVYYTANLHKEVPLIMPHAHVALLGAFGYISIAFLYMTSRANATAKGWGWNDKLSKWGFWLLTIGVLLFALPTIIIGAHQTQLAHDMGYFYTRTREAVEAMSGWMWFRIFPDGMMIFGGLIIFWDLFKKTFLGKPAQ
ncbi:MAG: cbb3-type cytochrome c oxidase subunit I [Prolixibacteraceae bacterium]|nr:cbb3-type cytochrome c oxidase subunit I [Prolixibacteraceae bacterium]